MDKICEQKILNDAKNAIICSKKIFRSLDDIAKKYGILYPFTTENIKEYFLREEIKKKDVLTVCSSGDHLFNALLLGAKNIDCFDTNVFTKYYMFLKKAAIKVLKYDEFLRFFIQDFSIFKNDYLFNYSLYEKLRSELNDEARLFWDYVYSEYSSSYKIRKSSLFFKDIKKIDAINYNLYLEEENYYKLKEIIDKLNPNFYECDITNLHNINKRRYQIIYLSNIYQFLLRADRKTNFIDLIKHIASSLLEEDGIIFLAYIYNYKFLIEDKEMKNPLYEELYRDLFEEEDFVLREFNSVDYANKDAILMYKKR